MSRKFILFPILIALLSSCNSNKLYGTIIDIYDGDTVKVATKKAGILKVRLLGIDCPEIDQIPWGEKAKEFLENEFGESLKVKLEADLVKKDKYGRYLAYIYKFNNKVLET